MKRLPGLAGLLILIPFACAAGDWAIVSAPVADVRAKPVPAKPGAPDDLQETQVLFGERVNVFESSGAWVRIEAVEQPEYTHHHRWEGYPGWMLRAALSEVRRANESARFTVVEPWARFNVLALNAKGEPEIQGAVSLPLGSHFPADYTPRGLIIPQIQRVRLSARVSDGLVETGRLPEAGYGGRDGILKAAQAMTGVPYVWGGLSPAAPAPDAPAGSAAANFGVDCSGLVHLVYRVNGVTIPRDSHEQWMKAAKIKASQLKPGDLVFSAKADHPQKIVHVAIYAGNGLLIEAPQTGMIVRQITFEEKFGVPVSQMKPGGRAGDRVVRFGRYLP